MLGGWRFREEPAGTTTLGKKSTIVAVDDPPLALLLLTGRLAMEEVAALAIHTIAFTEECCALLCLVLAIVITVLPELVGAMSKLTLVIVWTVAQ